jgi:hypothetical protein
VCLLTEGWRSGRAGLAGLARLGKDDHTGRIGLELALRRRSGFVQAVTMPCAGGASCREFQFGSWRASRVRWARSRVSILSSLSVCKNIDNLIPLTWHRPCCQTPQPTMAEYRHRQSLSHLSTTPGDCVRTSLHDAMERDISLPSRESGLKTLCCPTSQCAPTLSGYGYKMTPWQRFRLGTEIFCIRDSTRGHGYRASRIAIVS